MKEHFRPVLKEDLTKPTPSAGVEDLLLWYIYSRITATDVKHPSPIPLPVPDSPKNAGEAACRQQAVSVFLKEGYSYKQFCEMFGGPPTANAGQQNNP